MFLTEVMDCVPKRTGTVFFIHGGQVCSSVLTDVRFSEKRCPICVKKKKKLLKDVICAVTAVHKVKTSCNSNYLIQAEANVHGLWV